ncbi:rhombosortase [Rheinheimera sp. EpRS3]|nr:rhombosortase [Rheinheimera sp. EpRS3]
MPNNSLPANSYLTPYLILATLMVLFAILPDSWQQVLRYNRADISNSQYWRLFTGHLLHSNNWHLLMNLAGLLLAMLLHGSYYRGKMLTLQWLLCGLAISLALYYYSPQIHIYVGLSGLLHAMLTLGALKDIQLKLSTGWLLLAGLIGKVGWEQWQGPDAKLAELINASVATDAHLYGVCSGLGLGLLLYGWQRSGKK